MKTLSTIVLFICLIIFNRMILKHGVSRKWFSLLMPLSLAIVYIILPFLFVSESAVLVSTILFPLILLVGFPITYLTYPLIRRSVLRTKD